MGGRFIIDILPKISGCVQNTSTETLDIHLGLCVLGSRPGSLFNVVPGLVRGALHVRQNSDGFYGSTKVDLRLAWAQVTIPCTFVLVCKLAFSLFA